MKVHVSGDAGARSLPQVEAHVYSTRTIDLAKSKFRTLGESHQLLGDLNWERRQGIEVQIGQKQQASGDERCHERDQTEYCL